MPSISTGSGLASSSGIYRTDELDGLTPIYNDPRLVYRQGTPQTLQVLGDVLAKIYRESQHVRQSPERRYRATRTGGIRWVPNMVPGGYTRDYPARSSETAPILNTLALAKLLYFYLPRGQGQWQAELTPMGIRIGQDPITQRPLLLACLGVPIPACTTTVSPADTVPF